MLGWLAQKRLILEGLKSTFWFSFSVKIKFRTHSRQKSKKNKIEQCTKIFIYRDLNQWRLLQVGTGLEIELLNDSREVQRQDLEGTWPGAGEIL